MSSTSFHEADVEAPRRGQGRGASYFWSLLMLLTGLGFSILLSLQQTQREQNTHRADLRLSADEGQAALKAQLHSSELMVRAVQSLFLVSDIVTDAEFSHLYENLRPREQFPALRALAYARRETRPDGEHFITERIAPARGNEALIGLDVTRQAPNLVSLDTSRDADSPSLSAPFSLVQLPDSGTSAEGVVIRLPAYSPGKPPLTVAERRARLVGSIGVSFRATDLIRTALPPDSLRKFEVTVSDITDGSDAILFRSAPGANAIINSDTAIRFQRELAFGGRVWRTTLVASQPVAKTGWLHSLLPAGALISVLLSLLVWSVFNTQRRALNLGWRMSRRYRESEERFRALNELMPVLVLLADVADGQITYLNQAGRRLLGEPLVTETLPALFEDRQWRALLLQPDTPGCSNAEALLRNGSQRRFWASVSISRLHLDRRDQLVMVASDISEQRQLNDLLSHQATHDELTGLANRREFERRLGHAVASSGKAGLAKALLYIDLDQFKLINDTSGHAAGDQLLEQLARVMAEQVTGHDLLARLGGDEFGVMITDVDRPAVEHYAEQLRRSIDGYVFVWEENRFTITASIGGVMIDEHGLTLRDLFARADTACYMAKEMGRNRIHFYSPRDDEAARRRGEMVWANRLRRAADEQQLVLAYQEIWPLRPDADKGPRVELLLRFRDEAGQLVPPGAFLPAAERYGLMPMIDRWVIETALAQFDHLHPAGAGLKSAAINLSGASIEDVALADLIIELLQRYRIDPARVCFEITETVAVRRLSQVARFMGRLRAIGCRVALDDFGVGMSSFAYLKNLPVDIIKIDGSFVRDILVDPVSRMMVRSVTEIGHQLGKEVVAEWVIDDAIVAALIELGVDQAQGFTLHIPELALFHGL